MALDHVNRVWDAMGDGFWEITSFTLSANAGVQVKPPGLDEGRDMIRGSSDDFHHGIGGDPVADSVSWFRKSDNDPFVIDVTVIDINSYSRSPTTCLQGIPGLQTPTDSSVSFWSTRTPRPSCTRRLT